MATKSQYEAVNSDDLQTEDILHHPLLTLHFDIKPQECCERNAKQLVRITQ